MPKKSCSLAILLTCPVRESLTLSGNFVLSRFSHFLAMLLIDHLSLSSCCTERSLRDIVISMQEKLLNDEFLIDK
jgi:hypothetical protein